MAEDFGAMPTSPQLACFGWSTSLGFIRSALREKYGAVQASGYSATHEEFLEAKDKKEILAFVQEGLSREAKQSKFLNEVQAWNTGLFRAGFQAADELREKLTRALHDYTVKNLAGPIDPNETVARATRAIPSDERGSFRMGLCSFCLLPERHFRMFFGQQRLSMPSFAKRFLKKRCSARTRSLLLASPTQSDLMAMPS